MKIKKMIAVKALLPVCLLMLVAAGCKGREKAEVTGSVNAEANAENSSNMDAGDAEADISTVESEPEDIEEPGDDADKAEESNDTDIQEDKNMEEPVDNTKDKPDIVWIGDSLTQGSLGDDNNNENNPQAPWRVHGKISGRWVAGAGFYGCTAHDIFWLYSEYNGVKDPDIIYVYWVGSNDFFRSPDSVRDVIEETDHFNENAGITKFLMLGTTDRHDMDPEAHIPINKALEEHYGDKYLDIIPYLEYGPDGVHLTEKSYAAVAAAVNDKINEMWYN